MGAAIGMMLSHAASSGGGGGGTSAMASPTIWYRRKTGLYTDAGSTHATLSTDTIQQWSDYTGHGWDATQPTAANRLSYDTLGGVSNNASDKSLIVPAGAFTGMTAGEMMILFVRATDVPPDWQHSGLCFFGSYGGGQDTAIPGPDGTVYDGSFSTARKTFARPAGINFTAEHIYGVWSANADYGAHFDGTTAYNTATNSVGPPVTALLGRSYASTLALDKSIYAWAFWNRKLSSSERAAAVAFLKSDTGA